MHTKIPSFPYFLLGGGGQGQVSWEKEKATLSDCHHIPKKGVKPRSGRSAMRDVRMSIGERQAFGAMRAFNSRHEPCKKPLRGTVRESRKNGTKGGESKSAAMKCDAWRWFSKRGQEGIKPQAIRLYLFLIGRPSLYNHGMVSPLPGRRRKVLKEKGR